MRHFLAVLPIIAAAPQLVWGQAATSPASTPPTSHIQLTGRLVEGSRQVGGVAPMGAATVQIWDADNGVYVPLQDGTNSAAVTSGTRVFSATLAYALYDGQKIEIRPLDMSGAQLANEPPLAYTVPGLADWGRWRMEVAAGTVLSFDNGFTANTPSGNNTQSTLFLSLNVDKNWKWAGVRESSAPAPEPGSALPPAVAKMPYSVQVTVRFPSAVLPLHYSLSGSPAWLAVDGNGGLSGTPPMTDPAGSDGTKFTVTVADSSGTNDPLSAIYRIRVVDRQEVLLSGARTQLPPAVMRQAYDVQLEINLNGLTAPVTFGSTNLPG